MNELPSLATFAGEAPAVEFAAALTSPKTRRAWGTSWIGVACHPGPFSVPPAPLPSAATLENVTEPKFVRGTVRQKPSGRNDSGIRAEKTIDVGKHFTKFRLEYGG